MKPEPPLDWPLDCKAGIETLLSLRFLLHEWCSVGRTEVETEALVVRPCELGRQQSYRWGLRDQSNLVELTRRNELRAGRSGEQKYDTSCEGETAPDIKSARSAACTYGPLTFTSSRKRSISGGWTKRHSAYSRVIAFDSVSR